VIYLRIYIQLLIRSSFELTCHIYKLLFFRLIPKLDTLSINIFICFSLIKFQIRLLQSPSNRTQLRLPKLRRFKIRIIGLRTLIQPSNINFIRRTYTFNFTHVLLNTVIFNIFNFVTQIGFGSFFVEFSGDFFVIHLMSAHVFVTVAVHYSFVHFVGFIMVVSNSTGWFERFTSLFIVNLHCLGSCMVATEVLIYFHPVKRKPVLGSLWTRVTCQAPVLDTFVWFHYIAQHETWVQAWVLAFSSSIKAVIKYFGRPILVGWHSSIYKSRSLIAIIVEEFSNWWC